MRGEEGASRRWLAVGLGLALAGSLLSGPVALGVVQLTHPQPAWHGAQAFRESYCAVQLLPFALGLLLVSGFVLTSAALHCLAGARERLRTTAALLFTAVFAALIGFNYVLQLTFVPQLVLAGAASDALIGAFSMSNPASIAWGLEMWGYGVLGVATWLAAPVLARLGGMAGRAAALGFVLNGPVSLVGAALTVAGRGWLLGPLGLVAFGVWNALVIAMCGLGCWAARRSADAEPA
jgi:hypothetical protein